MGNKRERTRTDNRPEDEGDPYTSSPVPGKFPFPLHVTFSFALEDVESESTAERL